MLFLVSTLLFLKDSCFLEGMPAPEDLFGGALFGGEGPSAASRAALFDLAGMDPGSETRQHRHGALPKASALGRLMTGAARPPHRHTPSEEGKTLRRDDAAGDSTQALLRALVRKLRGT